VLDLCEPPILSGRGVEMKALWKVRTPKSPCAMPLFTGCDYYSKRGVSDFGDIYDITCSLKNLRFAQAPGNRDSPFCLGCTDYKSGAKPITRGQVETHGAGATRIFERVKLNRSLKRLKSQDNKTREAAVVSLERLGAADVLFACLTTDPSSNVRVSAARALGRLRDERAVAPLIRCLASKESDLRVAASEALDKLGRPYWKQWIEGDQGDFERLLTEPHQNVPKWGPPLQQALVYEEQPEVRVAFSEAVSEALARLGQPKWEAWVESDKCGFDKLAECGSSLSVDLLVATWFEPAIAALGQTGNPRFLEHILEHLKRPSNASLAYMWRRRRIVAARALGDLGDGCAVDPLIASLGNREEDWDVRKAAADALFQLRDERAVAPLAEFLDTKSDVQEWWERKRGNFAPEFASLVQRKLEVNRRRG
jgi:HEAT repeat protein